RAFREVVNEKIAITQRISNRFRIFLECRIEGTEANLSMPSTPRLYKKTVEYFEDAHFFGWLSSWPLLGVRIPGRRTPPKRMLTRISLRKREASKASRYYKSFLGKIGCIFDEKAAVMFCGFSAEYVSS